ncbi:MAG TPA: hypothetical protein VMI34_03865 [Candidatus Bathyarchaeia archaeon]|nr:hypothetical protein [Candidatus Bathyarchaeia archaeon]
MKTRQVRLFPGDLVEVKAPDHILETLDAAGTVDHLPFMPEMMEHCGRRFRVAGRVVKTCFSGAVSTMRSFPRDDVVTLEGLRCSGQAHGGCQKGCLIFWREAWLRKVEDAAAPSPEAPGGAEGLQARLRTTAGPATYFCQASELLAATAPLSRWQRLGKCVSEVRAGNCGALQMVRRVAIWLFWRLRRAVLGEYARGPATATPAEGLELQAGEWVEVKPMESIRETLNAAARNRGLYFSPNMRELCGGRYRVQRRLDRIIVDGSGEMRQLRNTVYLDGSPCGCAYTAFGGCSRGEYVYWREIWLRRVRSA